MCPSCLFRVDDVHFAKNPQRWFYPFILFFHPICLSTSLDAKSRTRTFLMTQFSFDCTISPFLQYIKTDCLTAIGLFTYRLESSTSRRTMASVSTNSESASNVTGATIFVGYVLAALCLSTLIVLDLYQSYKIQSNLSSSSTRAPSVFSRLQIFLALAVLSFSTLSYHMLSYLIYMYNQWVITNDPEVFPGPSNLLTLSTMQASRQIWKWLTESALFLNFAETICKNSANFWWTQQALFVSMASALFISIEGEASHA